MYYKEIKAYIIAISCIAICAGLFFSYKNISSQYEESYVNAMVHGYRLAADQGVLQIEYAVKYGKDINNFYNMDSILRQVADSVPSISNIKVINTKGEIPCSLYEDKNWSENPARLVSMAGSAEPSYTSDGNYYYIPQRIDDAKGNMVGVLVVSLKRDVLDDTTSGFNKEYSFHLLVFLIAAVILVITIVSRLKLGEAGKQLPQSGIIVLILLALVIIGVYNLYMIYVMSRQLSSSTEQIGSWVCSVVQLDMDSVVKKGATIDLIYDINGWLERICSNIPEIKNLYLNDENKVSAIISQAYIQMRMSNIILSCVLITAGVLVLQGIMAFTASLLKRKLSAAEAEQQMNTDLQA